MNKKIHDISEKPKAYVPKDIVAVTRDNQHPDDPGWIIRLSCGHENWCAVELYVGTPMYCGACINQFTEEVFKKKRI